MAQASGLARVLAGQILNLVSFAAKQDLFACLKHA